MSRSSGIVRVKLVEEFLVGKRLRYDILSRKIQNFLPSLTWSELTDRDLNTLWRECNEECGENIPYQVFRPVLMSDIIPSVNPLEEYVNGLPEWNEDMPDYIGEVAGMGRVREPLWAICFRKWFTAMVASWLHPGVANHQVLVLVGEQGI